MNIHEYQAKALLHEFGVPISRGEPVLRASDSDAAAKKLPGPIWVVKSQIHAGGRGKGKFKEASAGDKGGVRIAKSVAEVNEFAKQMLGATLVTADVDSVSLSGYWDDASEAKRRASLAKLWDGVTGPLAAGARNAFEVVEEFEPVRDSPATARIELLLPYDVNAYSVEIMQGVIDAGQKAGVAVAVSMGGEQRPEPARFGAWARDLAGAGRLAVITVVNDLTAADLDALARAQHGEQLPGGRDSSRLVVQSLIDLGSFYADRGSQPVADRLLVRALKLVEDQAPPPANNKQNVEDDLIEVRVLGARDDAQAKRVAKAIVNSPLVKTAVHGADPNWGRVAMAVGKCEDELDIDPDHALFFLSRINIERSATHSSGGKDQRMARWRKRLFIGLSHNAASPAAYFCLPPQRTVVMASRV